MSKESVYSAWDLEKEFNKEVRNVCIFQGSTDKLYHYTTLKALQGIVEAGKMRLTRIDSVNDATEVQYFHGLLKDVIKRHIRSDGRFFQDLMNEIENKKDEIYYPKNPRGREKEDSFLFYKEIFICSFSNCEDSLDMWKYYSKGDGVCIGILTNKQYGIEEDIDRYSKNSIVSVAVDRFQGGVVYKKDEQIEIVKKIIEIGQKSYDRFCEGSDDDIIRRCWANWFYRKLLFPISMFMKHEAFSTEQESRIAIVKRYIMSDENDWSVLAFQGQYPTQYEFVDGRIRPYVNDEIFDTKSPAQITLSPISRLDKKLLCEYLQSQKVKINGKNVMKSALPLRF